VKWAKGNIDSFPTAFELEPIFNNNKKQWKATVQEKRGVIRKITRKSV
jgi:hypothetical protein